jgi:phage shock protein A
MNLLERVLTLLGANLNTVVEKADDPEQALRQLQLDMRNQLVQVKTQVATAIAESHKLQRRSQERQGEADKWLKKAELAVQQGNDNAARDALSHYNELNRHFQRYQQQRESQDQVVVTMRNALRQLEAKIAEVETTIDLLATHKRNALIQQRVYEALNKSSASREKEQAAKAQDTSLDAEVRAQTLANLQNQMLDAQIEQLTVKQKIEHHLKTTREKDSLSPQIPHANDNARRHTSPLVSTPLPLERAPMPDHSLPKQSERQTVTKNSQELDVEHLKQILDNNPDIRENPQ